MAVHSQKPARGQQLTYDGAQTASRRGVSPVLVIVIAVLALVVGGLVGMFVLGDVVKRPQTPVSSSLTASQLTMSVGSYTYKGVRYDITAQEAIEDSVSLDSVRQDDGTYATPTADMIISYARNRILADIVSDNGVSVSDDDLNDYLQQLMGTTDISQIANQYGMSESQARTILTEAAAVKKLRDEKVGDVPTAPTAPTAPSDGDTETANSDYYTYIVNLLGDNWDSSNNTWANTDNAYYSVLKDATFSGDSANYEAAQLAYYVAYQQYQSQSSTVSAQWTDFVNSYLQDAAITVNTLLS